LLEALTHGLPIIASNVSGVSDIVEDGVNGLLVDPSSPQRLAEAIVTLWNNPKMRITMGKKSLEFSEKFSPKRIVPKLLFIYEKTTLRIRKPYTCDIHH